MRDPIPRAPRRRRRLPVLALVPLMIFGFAFFGLSYLVTPEPDIEVQTGVGFATVDGRELVLVPYARHGARGMFQLMVRDMFQVRLAAADLATGDVVWDTQLSDRLVWEASVLATGQRYAYLATDSGLVVVDLRSGSEVAAKNDVAGLGDRYIAGRAAYGYDVDSHSVVAMNADGAILTIALDSTTAIPAEPQTAARWTGVLATDRFPDVSGATAAKVALATGEKVELRDRAVGKSLVRVAGGQETPVGDTVFQRAALVVDGTTSEHVVVQHNRTVNSTDMVLSVVALRTGAITGVLPIKSSPNRAVTAPDGTTAVVTHDEVATVTATGRITALNVGTTNFFGN
ncbi:hypothetical protein GCM10029964_095430 [Kibdelosporangium lantanae]